MDIEAYNHIRSGGAGFYEQKRGLIAVWGKEAVQFLDGMITNDMKTLEDGQQMLAAFPNAQGRLIAVVRVQRQGDRFLIDTDEATREKLFNNLFRFTYAGDFFVEDLSDGHKYFEVIGADGVPSLKNDLVRFVGRDFTGYFVPFESAEEYVNALEASGAANIGDELYETLRIESGIPKYGVDMDENTIVPELGFPEMISYTKGCYIGQEIIARIHFRGRVAKQFAGLVCDGLVGPGTDLSDSNNRNAGRVTSVTYSPMVGQNIALAFVRYDYLTEGTEVLAVSTKAKVCRLPFQGLLLEANR